MPAEATRTVHEWASSYCQVKKVRREKWMKELRDGTMKQSSAAVSWLVSSARRWWKVRRQTCSCFYTKHWCEGGFMTCHTKWPLIQEAHWKHTSPVHPVSRNTQNRSVFIASLTWQLLILLGKNNTKNDFIYMYRCIGSHRLNHSSCIYLSIYLSIHLPLELVCHMVFLSLSKIIVPGSILISSRGFEK